LAASSARLVRAGIDRSPVAMGSKWEANGKQMGSKQGQHPATPGGAPVC
jgi:hypothetical protein